MAIRRGFAKVKEAKESSGKGGGGDGLRFMLKDGGTAIVRFYGDFESQQDPVVGVTHYVRRLPPGKQYHNCTDNLPEGADNPGCVFDHLIAQGDKGVKKQQRAYFFLKDLRKVHKLEGEVRILKPGIPVVPGRTYKNDDYITTKYPPCYAPKRVCPYCSQGNVAQIEGWRHWELAVQYADQLLNQQSAIREMCKSCAGRDEEGNGTIQVVRYLCGNQEVTWADGSTSPCGQPIDYDPARGQPVASCSTCNQTLPPLEEIACANCDAPARCDLQDFLFKVTRTGGGTDTTYNFEPVQQKSPTEEDIAEAASKRPDFEAMLQPEAPELQAAHLGIPSPFHTPGHGATQYGGVGPARPGGPPQQRPGGLPHAAPQAAAPQIRKLGIKTNGSAPAPPKLGPPKLRATAPVQEEEVDYGSYE